MFLKANLSDALAIANFGYKMLIILVNLYRYMVGDNDVILLISLWIEMLISKEKDT